MCQVYHVSETRVHLLNKTGVINDPLDQFVFLNVLKMVIHVLTDERTRRLFFKKRNKSQFENFLSLRCKTKKQIFR